MKQIPYRAFLLTLCLVGLTACNNEEFFELTNPVESPWQSIAEFEKAPIGAYYTLTGNGGFRSMFGHGRMAGELFADGVNLADPAAGYPRGADAEDMYNRTTGVQIALMDNAVWRNGYFAVGHANGALDFIEENGGNPFPEAGPNATDRIEGELRFIRAYAYFWLAKMYLPPYPNDEKRIPFRLNQAKSFEEAISSELASANDIYPVIVDDLIRAKELLPERYDPEVHPPEYADGRANKFAAAALLAKVYFQMAEYDLALAELNFVIDQNGGDYDLSEEPIEAWNKTGVERGKEVLWYYALWAGDGLGGPSNWKHPGRFQEYNALNRDGGAPEENGGRYIVASDDFLQQVGWINPDLSERPEALQDLRYTQLFTRFEEASSPVNPEPRSAFAPTRPYVWGNKYYRAGRRLTNLPILRLADMYLLRAAILAGLGNTTDAAQARADLNMVRNRAGLADYGGSDAELLDAVHLERFREMAFEGDRLYYLQGVRAPIPAGDRGGDTVPWDSPFFSEVPDFEKDFNLAY